VIESQQCRSGVLGPAQRVTNQELDLERSRLEKDLKSKTINKVNYFLSMSHLLSCITNQ
jgi:hypothetical protein